ncbi:hypothetical protein FRC04_011721 [Tulasnella sp. 424]|nr:hypothetical protein FRC04_011721 [Tulasnella sp. 424]KAG8978067.1 hypothetical protein FRC05_011182 [Tulasnella sp. 425]
MASIPLNQLTIKQATPPQVELSRRLTWAEWNRGRSVEEYLRQDAEMDKYSFCTNNRYFTWVLVPRNEPDTLAFLSSCETYRRNVVVKHEEGAGGTTGYGIASVFTRPEFRGKGYAAHMMRLLHWVLAPHQLLPQFPHENWGPPPAQTFGDAAVSVLYSDIGRFYERCGPIPDAPGWTSTPRHSAIWTVDENGELSQLTQVRWLDEQLVEDFLREDDNMITKELNVSSDPEPRFTFLPGDNQVAFQIKRYLISLEDTKAEPPKVFGVSVPQSSLQASDPGSTGENDKSGLKSAFAVWTFEPKPLPSRLIICRLRVTPETFPSILDAAHSEARKAGVQIVEAWNLPEELQKVVESTGGKTVEREDHWPCMAWYGINAVPGSIGWRQTIKWTNNEK